MTLLLRSLPAAVKTGRLSGRRAFLLFHVGQETNSTLSTGAPQRLPVHSIPLTSARTGQQESSMLLLLFSAFLKHFHIEMEAEEP